MLKPITETEYLSFPEAARKLPGRIHVNTLQRWARKGFGGTVLESWKIGNKRFTTADALVRFCEATSKVPHVKSHAYKQAKSKLASAGIV